MRPVTEKVLQRLVYEKLLLASQIRPMRKKISLEEFLDAALEESRIYTALAAILLYKPKIFHNLKNEIKNHPEIKKFVDNLFLDRSNNKLFGLDKTSYQKNARAFRDFLEKEKDARNPMNRMLTLRLSDNDMDRLQKLTEKLGKKSVGDTIRSIVNEKARDLTE